MADSGEVVRGRCRATNLCDYCAKLAAVETSEALALDALETDAPAVWIVLTTATPDPEPRRFYRSREALWKAIQRRWPEAEYAAMVEFTTGYGPKSGRLRRPHWNLLIKGVPAGDVDRLKRVVDSIWCRREHAEPWSQHVGVVSEAGGLMRYIALHFLKESQRPPKGWRGHRFSSSRGYFRGKTAAEARGVARASLRRKRALWKLERAGVTDAHDRELLAALELKRADALEWRLVHVNPSTVELGRERTTEREAYSSPCASRPLPSPAPTGAVARDWRGLAAASASPAARQRAGP